MMTTAVANGKDERVEILDPYGISKDILLTKHILTEQVVFINKLITSASALLMILNNINKIKTTVNIELFRDAILQEIQAFKSLAKKFNYSKNEIEHANYCLCAAIDEAILKTPWGMESTWSKHTLLGELYNDLAGGIKFFTMLEESLQDKKITADLLTLIHVILSIGYEGQYFTEEGNSIRDTMRQMIFRKLQLVCKPSKNLHKIVTYTKAANKKYWHCSFFRIIAGTIIILVGIICTYNLLTQKLAEPAFVKLKQLHYSYFNVFTERGDSL